MCRHIGEYISLELFYFVSLLFVKLTNSCSLHSLGLVATGQRVSFEMHSLLLSSKISFAAFWDNMLTVLIPECYHIGKQRNVLWWCTSSYPSSTPHDLPPPFPPPPPPTPSPLPPFLARLQPSFLTFPSTHSSSLVCVLRSCPEVTVCLIGR